MNILFFLKPKSEVAFVYDDCTLRQALEVMQRNKYSAIPMISREGEVTGTLTEGDILWGIKDLKNLNVKSAEKIYIRNFPRKTHFGTVAADATMEDLIKSAMSQNFVPVVDDQKKFIGIITRRSIIEYCYSKLINCENKSQGVKTEAAGTKDGTFDCL